MDVVDAAEKINDQCDLICRQWDLIRDLWHQIDVDYVLAQEWPLEYRYVLDLLIDRMLVMDRLSEAVDLELLLVRRFLVERLVSPAEPAHLPARSDIAGRREQG